MWHIEIASIYTYVYIICELHDNTTRCVGDTYFRVIVYLQTVLASVVRQCKTSFSLICVYWKKKKMI